MLKLSSLLCAMSFALCAAENLKDFPLERTIALEGQTYHVQGVAIGGSVAYITAVERDTSKGWLFEYDLSTGKRLRAVELQQGPRFHPGGLDIDDESIWIPVAEYRKESSTIVQRRSRATLELMSSFEVHDHIGCLTWTGSILIGGNWDARRIYEWAPNGTQLKVRPNPRPTRYQELKFRYGTLIGSGPTAIEWLDPETLAPLRTIGSTVTDRKVSFTQEGCDFVEGLLYLLPEDSPSRIFIFRAN